MEMKESLNVKIIKRVYGITGVIDEYRKGKIDEIGNKAFMLLYWYVPLSTFLSVLFVEKNPKIALLALTGSNLFIFMGISVYIVLKTSRLKLTDIEVEKKEIKVTRRKLVIKNIEAMVFFAVGIYFLNALITSVMDDVAYLSVLKSSSHIKSSLLGGVIFGTLMLIFSFMRLKKIEE